MPSRSSHPPVAQEALVLYNQPLELPLGRRDLVELCDVDLSENLDVDWSSVLWRREEAGGEWEVDPRVEAKSAAHTCSIASPVSGAATPNDWPATDMTMLDA